MNGEGHQNRDDKGFFPHSENAGADDGQTGEDLEAHLQVFERSKGFLEHLNTSNGHARGGQNRNQQAVIAQKFRHHHDDENGEGDATSDKSPLVGTQAIGLGHSKGRLNAKHSFQCLFSGLKKRFIAAHHQLNENAVVIRNFSVQHTRLSADDAFQFLNGHPVSACNRHGSNADDFVVFNIGCMSEGTQHGGHF